jgi:23S rRNA G2445 N2-methylase RlmL
VARGEIQDRLLDRARAAGFTPGRRDIAPLLDSVVSAEEERDVRSAERALARRAELALPAALARLAAAERASERARLLRLVGRVAGADGRACAEVAAAAAAALGDPDPRVRRQAALALGRTGPGAEAALVAAWSSEAEPSVRRALATALGTAGGERAVAALRAEPAGDDPELRRLVDRALLTASRTIERARPSEIDPGAAPAAPLLVALRCRAGLERVLAGEVDAAGWPVERVAPGQVETRLAGPLASLHRFRVHMTASFPLPARTGSAERAVVDALVSPEAAAIFGAFTRGAVRFRIEWEQGGHRRAEVWRIAGEVAARRPDLVNDPTDTTWRVRVSEGGGAVAIALEPRKLDDPRFAYRVADVPAASHPTVAAGLARLAAIHSPAPAADVVWDPFVGSGLELCERGRLAPVRRLVGSDASADAIEAARANLASAGVTAELSVADALTHEVAGATVLLTNPPMGRRVLRGRALPVLDGIVDRAAAILPVGGILCWISPIPGHTRARAADAGLRLIEAITVDMGGFAAEIQVLRREATASAPRPRAGSRGGARRTRRARNG